MERRELTLSEGSSHKFWNIALEGSSHTVQYGRIGTAGQTQTKDFATDEEARTSFNKLVAEKLKKGYVDAAGGEQTASAAPAAKPTAKAPTPKDADLGEPETEAAPAPEATPLDEEPRRILLTAEDLRWAHRRGQPAPLPLPAPKPFDLADAAARLEKIGKDAYSYNWRWSAVRIPISMTPEEADFWLDAMTGRGMPKERYSYNYTPQQLAEYLAKQTYDGTRTKEDFVKALQERRAPSGPELVLPYVAKFGAAALVDLFPAYQHMYYISDLLDGFRKNVLPHMSEDEKTALRERLMPAIGQYATVEPEMWSLSVAALLGGMAEPIAQVVAKWPDGMGHPSYWRPAYGPLEALFGLEDPDRIVAEARRLKLFPLTADQVRAFLACTEYRGLDVIRDGILAEGNKAEVEPRAKAFTRVEAPEAAPHMLDLMLESKAPRIAREWLEAHPVHTIEGLLPVAGSGQGKRHEAAVEFLRTLKRRGYGDLIRAKAETLGETARENVLRDVVEYEEKEYSMLDDASTPGWLREALAAAPKSERADVERARDLPPLLVPAEDGELRRLTDVQTGGVLAALRKSPLDAPNALLTAIKQKGDPRAADSFAWRIFESWLADGGPSKAKWEMLAVGHLGDDASALKIAPMVRAWPGESQHQRAVTGLEVLRAIGTDTALMQINGIAQKVSFKGLKAKAGEAMEAIARDRNLSRAELEDRIVPDCGLDARGTRVFDFGPRKFTFVLGADMKPMIRDEARQRRPDLPKPNSKDDPALSEAAVAEWKLLKKQVADITKIQAVRLEQAMVTGRRWNPDAFDLLLVRHPLMTNLVRLLVWGAYDADGALLGTFRVTEDQTLADESDDTYELPAEAAGVGIVHPLHLSEAQRSAWGEIFSDYEIVPPFPQLGRPIYRLEPGEAEAQDLAPRFKGVKIPPQTLVFTLEKRDWQRGAPMDAGVFTEHVKVFAAANVSAYVTYDGVPVGYMEGWDDQEIESVFFIRGTDPETGYVSLKHAKEVLKLGEVDPVAISEVLTDVSLIVAKGKPK